MSGFSFIHAADLHLGSPLSGLATRDAELARRLATAGRQAFEGLVTRAIERRVAFVVVAGDIYDRALPAAGTVAVFEYNAHYHHGERHLNVVYQWFLSGGTIGADVAFQLDGADSPLFLAQF